jgi:hypothetical protein
MILPQDNSKALSDWLSVFELTQDRKVGVSRDGYWVLQSRNTLVALHTQSVLRDLLLCLENPIKEIKDKLIQGLRFRSIPAELLDSFPFEKIIHTGFASESDYWAGLALNWLDEVNPTDVIKDDLLEVVDSKWASQRNRQRAKQYLRKWPPTNSV